MNTVETGRVLTVLTGAYPHYEIPDETALLWAELFSGDEYRHVNLAVSQWVVRESRFPAPSDIKAQVRILENREREANEQPRPVERGRLIGGPEGGFDIAYNSYCDYVTAEGREPQSFEQFVGKLIPKRKAYR